MKKMRVKVKVKEEDIVEGVATIAKNSASNTIPNATTLTVVKRGGTIVPFQPVRIEKAIELAFRDTKNIDTAEKLDSGLLTTIKRLAEKAVTRVFELGEKGVSLSVEGIQDIVEVTLMKSGFHDVARDYIIYRDQHKEARDSQPSNIKIYRKDGRAKVRFNPMKVSNTIAQTFRRTLELGENPLPGEIIKSVNELTHEIIKKVVLENKKGNAVNLFIIEDMIEETLMREGSYIQAKEYILFRMKKSEAEEKTIHHTAKMPKKRKGDKEKSFKVVGDDNSSRTITESEIRQKITFASRGFEKIVKVEELFESTLMNFYEGIKEDEVDTALIMAARAKVEIDPAYSYVASRLLLDKVYREALEVSVLDPTVKNAHKSYFKSYIKKGISLKRIAPALLDYDLDMLADSLDLERDNLLQYHGLQTLYDRYFIHDEGQRLETPQIFWMRVAMGLALKETKKNEKAVEFYNILSQFYYTPGTPTLFNSGTTHSQLSSCFLSTVNDDLVHIFKVISDDAQLSKWAGGLGNDWTSVRATGSVIKGTNGKSQGVIPFLKVANDTAVAVNQGGKRKGALCSYLETWHLDIEDFIELRKNTGDERRRTHDMNTANWIPDLFIKRVQEGGQWTLFSPSDVPDLHELYGKSFKKAYEEYEKMADEGKIALFKRIDATTLWRKMLSMLFETGHPWITFKDPSNIRSPQDHTGVVHSSNLCTEILLNTSRDEVAVCNIGSVNVVKHIKADGSLDKVLLEKDCKNSY